MSSDSARSAGALVFAVFLAGVGCQKPQGSPGDASKPKPGAPPEVDLVVDANRDGQLDLSGTSDEAGKNGFTATTGAVVLANLDDDDGDGKPDASDPGVAGDSDTRDFSPVAVRSFPSAPAGATGVLSVDAASAAHVRLFRVNAEVDRAASYVEVEGLSAVPLSNGDVRAGVRFALEATAFVGTTSDGWSGRVELTYQVTDAQGASLGTDHAALRVAPVLFQWNTAKTEHVYYSDGAELTDSLRTGVAAVCTDGVDEQGLELGNDFDQWAQDFFDVAYTSRPGPNGQPVGMKVFIRSPQVWRTAGADVIAQALGPDVATVYVHDPAMDPNSHGDSMGSFGDWDVVPPYVNGSEHYPLGRNFWGQGQTAAERPDPKYVAFVTAQAVQPPLNIDTSFLAVGHVDEITSFVQANTPRGWGLLAARPALARSMLQSYQAAGQGATQMFVGRQDYDLNDTSPNPPMRDAAVSIDDVLANQDLMDESQTAEVAVDAAVVILQREVGLSDGEVTPMPFLFEPVFGAGLAFQPGTVNLLHVDGRVVVPETFGPLIDGVDPFRAGVISSLSALGLDVHFADDWDTYHIEMGEVHCGTNVSRDLAVNWWESGR